MNSKDQKEKQLLEEIKTLSQRISQAKSFAGIMMYQSEIQRFYEDFIFLKKAYENKSLKEWAQPQEVQNETRVENTPQTEDSPAKKETPEVEAKPEPIKEPKIDYNFSIHSSNQLKPLQIDVNDNIAFLKVLFDGHNEEYNTFIETLNNRNQTTSVSYINHFVETLGWGKNQQEYVDRLLELNHQRFE